MIEFDNLMQFVIAEVAVATIIVGVLRYMIRPTEKRVEKIESQLEPHLRESTGIQTRLDGLEKTTDRIERKVYNGNTGPNRQ